MKKIILLFTGLLLVAAIVYMAMYGKKDAANASAKASHSQNAVPTPPVPPTPPEAPIPPNLPEIPKIKPEA